MISIPRRNFSLALSRIFPFRACSPSPDNISNANRYSWFSLPDRYARILEPFEIPPRSSSSEACVTSAMLWDEKAPAASRSQVHNFVPFPRSTILFRPTGWNLDPVPLLRLRSLLARRICMHARRTLPSFESPAAEDMRSRSPYSVCNVCDPILRPRPPRPVLCIAAPILSSDNAGGVRES